MQQKNLKYLLLIGVTFIWGAVIYRVLSGMGDNNTIPAVPQKLVFRTNDSSNYQPYDLLANYEDPFGADEDKSNLESATDSLIKATESFLQNTSGNIEAHKPDISFIRYRGIITNPASHKTAAIISINGKDEFVQPNSKLADIRINTIKKDKILITYLNEKYWIKRQ